MCKSGFNGEVWGRRKWDPGGVESTRVRRRQGGRESAQLLFDLLDLAIPEAEPPWSLVL